MFDAAKFTFARCFCIRYYEAEYSVYPIVHRWPRLVYRGAKHHRFEFRVYRVVREFSKWRKTTAGNQFYLFPKPAPLSSFNRVFVPPLHPDDRIKFAISRDLPTRFLPCPLPSLSPSFPFLPAYRFWDGKRLRKTDLEGLNSIRSKHSREDRAQFNRARLPTIYPRYL